MKISLLLRLSVNVIISIGVRSAVRILPLRHSRRNLHAYVTETAAQDDRSRVDRSNVKAA